MGDPDIINVDKNPAYPAAFAKMQKKGIFEKTSFRRIKYLNNIIEQDHRSIKRQHRQAMGYHSLKTAKRTIDGIESMHRIFKGQIESLPDVNAFSIKNFSLI